jgi:hypothetical protein
VSEALGGIVASASGHGGIGLRKGDVYSLPPKDFKEIASEILRYAILAVVVVLIAIFSMFRATGGFHGS